jgi:hypothetical protein
VGMDWKTVAKTFEAAYDEDNYVGFNRDGKIFTYAAMYIGYGYCLKFYVINNKVEKN